ncbi:MAG: hypothetical protein LBD06_01805 [Candidatus Accumulibacter sp.]|jgi:hypothetical protein|nr:hypothetical protein [Accumulibacter sp.]
MRTVDFFNDEGGVGKTSLVHHLAGMDSDLDPWANLTAVFLGEPRLEVRWPDDGHPATAHGALPPIPRGAGDISDPHVETISHDASPPAVSGDPHCLASFEPVDGVIGARGGAARSRHGDFYKLAERIEDFRWHSPTNC